jgi:hypothetical protein
VGYIPSDFSSPFKVFFSDNATQCLLKNPGQMAKFSIQILTTPSFVHQATSYR